MRGERSAFRLRQGARTVVGSVQRVLLSEGRRRGCRCRPGRGGAGPAVPPSACEFGCGCMLHGHRPDPGH